MTSPDMHNLDQMTEAELADHYNRTHDLSEFDGGRVVAPPNRRETRSVTISVRFSPSELAQIEAEAAESGVPLTAFIRTAAMEAVGPPIDRDEVLDLVAALRASVEGAKRRRADAEATEKNTA